MKYLLFLILIPCYTTLQAFTGDSLYYLKMGDTLNLSISPFNEKLIDHYFEKGQTLFSLAQFYGLSVDELKFYNPGLLDGVDIGDRVQIPIPNRAIIRYGSQQISREGSIPIYYHIQKGDTFYGLSNRLFKMPVEELKIRLIPYGDELKIGQKLFVGWISIDGVPEDYRLVRGHPLLRKNRKLQPLYQAQISQGKKQKLLRGAAVWKNEKDKDDSNFFVLFDGAKKGSYVELYSPLRGRRVYAKVLGPIPEGVYDDAVKIITSTITAKLLGAIDGQFYVEIKFF